MSHVFISDEDYAVALSRGISKQNVNNRVREHDWSVQKAITKPVSSNERWGYSKVRKQCEKLGISSDCFRMRRRKGWSIKKASTTPVANKNGTKGRKPKYDSQG
jgi:hypothetical protein